MIILIMFWRILANIIRGKPLKLRGRNNVQIREELTIVVQMMLNDMM